MTYQDIIDYLSTFELTRNVIPGNIEQLVWYFLSFKKKLEEVKEPPSSAPGWQGCFFENPSPEYSIVQLALICTASGKGEMVLNEFTGKHFFTPMFLPVITGIKFFINQQAMDSLELIQMAALYANEIDRLQTFMRQEGFDYASTFSSYKALH